MSRTPKQLVTLGKLFENNNSISDYEKDASDNSVTENTVVYPLTPSQIEHVKKYGPNEKDDKETAAYKANWFDPEKARSGLFDRIKARFSEKYLKDTVALLGYNIGTEELDKAIQGFDVYQVLNHIFKADVNRYEALFSMEKFRHRPIFCGVNVMYDPTADDKEFNNVRHTKEYFDDGWKDKYNNAEYLADSKTGEHKYRDITFSPKFLDDLQNKAGEPKATDSSELIALFTRNGFSVGISSVDSSGLGPESELPAQYSRVFINKWQDEPIYDYNTTLMRSASLRLKPTKGASDSYEYIQNKLVILKTPALQNEDGKETERAATSDKYVDHPCIIFAGDTLINNNPKEGEHKGYDLATYTAVPLCSWKYFSEESEYANTKAVDRLKATNQCGPFTRVIAKGFYSNAISNILQTYTEIDLKLQTYTDGNGDTFTTFGYMNEDKFELLSVDHRLRAAAAKEYNRLKDKSTDKNDVDDIELYESAYYRNNKDNYPKHIQDLFNATKLPLRFAFFHTKNDDDIYIHIRQYPATPLLGALPMQDDYITQLVPIYRSLNETPTEKTGINWYINPHDILINGVAGKFYNVSQQSYVKKTYPATKGDGVMFTYTGHLYKGAEEGNTKWPATIDAIHMGKKKGDSTVILGEIDTSLQYKTDPIMIAPNNYLQYMTSPEEPNESRASRKAYIEFIKQGCVWQDSDGNEPEKNGVIPNTPPVSLDLSIYADDIEKSTKMVHSKATEEPEKEEVNKKSLTAAIIVLVVLVALIVIFIIYRVIKKRKLAALGIISQGFFCGD